MQFWYFPLKILKVSWPETWKHDQYLKGTYVYVQPPCFVVVCKDKNVGRRFHISLSKDAWKEIHYHYPHEEF